MMTTIKNGSELYHQIDHERSFKITILAKNNLVPYWCIVCKKSEEKIKKNWWLGGDDFICRSRGKFECII
jgi:hypothetical protein